MIGINSNTFENKFIVMKKSFTKILFVFTLIIGAAFISSCDDENEIEIGIPQTQIQIFSIDGANKLTVDTSSIVASNLDSVLASKGATRDDISGIQLDSVKLYVCDSNGVIISTENFSSVKELTIRVGKTTVGNSLVVVASADSATMSAIHNSNPIKLPLPVGGFDFLPYVSQPEFIVNMQGRLNQVLTNTFYIKAEISLLVKAKI